MKTIYQYRIFNKIINNNKKYDQFDLYFYKKEINNINVKIRFSIDEIKKDILLGQQVQIKMIMNEQQLIDNYRVEGWYKTYQKFDEPMKIYSPTYIKNNIQKFKTKDESLQDIYKTQLSRINQQIIYTLSKKLSLNKVIYQNHHNLLKWLSYESKIDDFFIIQKNKNKFFGNQQGTVKVRSFYNMINQVDHTFQTVCLQHKNAEKLKEMIKKKNLQKYQNMNYIKLISTLI